MSLRVFILIYPPSESSSVDNSSIEEKIDSYLRSFSTKHPSSNCARVIMSPVRSWYYIVYGIYDTDFCMASAS